MNWFKKRKAKDTSSAKDTSPRDTPSKDTPSPVANVLNSYVYDVDVDGVTTYYHSFVGNALVSKHGLKGCIISGKVKNPEHSGIEDSFIANSQFKETVTQFVDTVLRKDPGLIQAAENQAEGYVYVIDKRIPDPNGRVEVYDIMGAFKVENKVLGAFQGNAKYQIKSVNGLIDFGPQHNAKFQAFLEALLISEETT